MSNKHDGFPYADPATPGNFAHKPSAEWRAGYAQAAIDLAVLTLDPESEAAKRLFSILGEVRAARALPPPAPDARAGERAILGNLLTDIAQILDVVRQEWGAAGCWSDFDQRVRERITAALMMLNQKETHQ